MTTRVDPGNVTGKRDLRVGDQVVLLRTGNKFIFNHTSQHRFSRLSHIRTSTEDEILSDRHWNLHSVSSCVGGILGQRRCSTVPSVRMDVSTVFQLYSCTRPPSRVSGDTMLTGGSRRLRSRPTWEVLGEGLRGPRTRVGRGTNNQSLEITYE